MQGSMAPPLPEEIIEEILLRFPPDEPACLFRASVVCKPWCCLISSPGFRRRYRKFRRAAPMLGFLHTIFPRNHESEYARFVPTSAFCPPLPDVRSCSAIDARHGRVLLRCTREENSWERRFVVWDPISDVRREVPMNPRAPWYTWNWNAAVLCAAAAGTCDHLDCHGGSFFIVSVGSRPDSRMLVISTYSSDSGTWSNTVSPHHPYNDGLHSHVYICSSPGAHVGNALYFLSQSWKEVVRYDLCSHEVSVFRVPEKSDLYQPNALTSTEDGGRLRYTIIYGFKLHMWSRKDDPQVDAGWTHNRVIDLETQLRSNAILTSPRVAGSADAIGVVFLRAEDMLFTFDLKTENLKNVSKGKAIYQVLPYMRFYTPGTRPEQLLGVREQV